MIKARGGGDQAHQARWTCDGKKVHTVGVPIHWGFVGVAKPGYLANTLTPFVGDANTQTPEFKAFLVNIEKAVGEAPCLAAIPRHHPPLGHHHCRRRRSARTSRKSPS